MGTLLALLYVCPEANRKGQNVNFKLQAKHHTACEEAGGDLGIMWAPVEAAHKVPSAALQILLRVRKCQKRQTVSISELSLIFYVCKSQQLNTLKMKFEIINSIGSHLLCVFFSNEL